MAKSTSQAKAVSLRIPLINDERVLAGDVRVSLDLWNDRLYSGYV